MLVFDYIRVYLLAWMWQGQFLCCHRWRRTWEQPFIFQRTVHVRESGSKKTARSPGDNQPLKKSTHTQSVAAPVSSVWRLQPGEVCVLPGAPSWRTERAGCGARWSGIGELLCRWRTGGCVFPHQADQVPGRTVCGCRVWAVSTEEGDFDPSWSWGEATWARRGVWSWCTPLKAPTHCPDIQPPIQPLSDHSVASCLTRLAEKLYWTHHFNVLPAPQ